jgi:FkbM family methyltransferase
MTTPSIPGRALLLRRVFGNLQHVRGVPRLLWILRTWAFPTDFVLVASPDGLPVTIARDDYGQVMLFYFRYCPELQAFLCDVLQPGDICMDLGANVGLLSALMIQCVSPHGKVLAVEPNRRVAAQLQSTAKVHFPEQTQIIHAGIASSVGHGLLIRPENSFSESFEVAASSISGESIQLTTIDQLVEQHCPDHLPDFIKVDIEGYEADLIQSMQGMLTGGHRPLLLIEFHAEKCRKRGVPVEEIRRELISLGYQERQVEASGDGYRLSVPPPTLAHQNILYATQKHLSTRPALAVRWHEHDRKVNS